MKTTAKPMPSGVKQPRKKPASWAPEGEDYQMHRRGAIIKDREILYFVQGSVVFAGGNGILSQNNENLFWDNENNRLGIGTTTPRRKFDILDASNPPLRISHTENNVYAEFQTTGDGVLGLIATGNAFTMTGATLALGKEVETALYHKQVQYLLEGANPILLHQTYYWDGSSFIADNGYGFGYQALRQNTGASSNGFGYQALRQNTGASSNGFGHQALFQNTGASSSGFGHLALYQNTGDYSSGFGHLALFQNTGASSNGFGYQALYQNTGASSNGFGRYALRFNNWPNTIAIGNQITTYFQADASSEKTFTDANVNATAHTITIAGHGFGSSGKINLKYKTISGTAPTGLVHNTIYQFTITDANVLTLLAITGIGSGTFSLTNSINITNTIVIGHETNATKANQVVIGNASIVETLLRGNVCLPTIKSGATQVGAGADAGDLWKTSGHATLPNNVVMIGG